MHNFKREYGKQSALYVKKGRLFMIDISLSKENIENIKNNFKFLGNKGIKKAINRASKRAISNIRKEISKEVVNRYFIKSGDVNKTSSLEKLKSIYCLKYSGSPIPLANFKVSPLRQVEYKKTSNNRKLKAKRRSNPKIYKAKVLKRSSLKGVKNMFVVKNQALIRPQNTIKNEKPNNWLAFGPSVPQMVKYKGVLEKITENGREVFQNRLNHEIEQILTERGGNA